MHTPDGILFAPGIPFRELRLDDQTALASALELRALRWFLEPARAVAESAPFAAGVIVSSFIDAAARYEKMSMAEWLCQAVPESADIDPRRSKRTIADSFVEDIRHGLVHHNRLKRGAEFSLYLEAPLSIVDSVLIVNPLALLEAIEKRWQETLAAVRSNADFFQQVSEEIGRVFRVDFEADQEWEEERPFGEYFP